MLIKINFMHAIFCSVFLRGIPSVPLAEVPEGFQPIFNGQDLAGWHGMPHFDPRDLAKMTPENRAKQIAEWTEDSKKHWTVENEELVNDGHGAYLVTDREYTDYELLIDYKTVPLADSGILFESQSTGADLGLHGRGEVQYWSR